MKMTKGYVSRSLGTISTVSTFVPDWLGPKFRIHGVNLTPKPSILTVVSHNPKLEDVAAAAVPTSTPDETDVEFWSAECR